MGYDALVDKTQLESALTATADAIRGKTGGTDKIAWASDTGFKSAVENISASEDLDAELTAQASLISELSAVLDSKASGGIGDDETYELSINQNTATTLFQVYMFYSAYNAEGVLYYNNFTAVKFVSSISGYIVSNIRKKTPVFLYQPSNGISSVEVSDGLTLEYFDSGIVCVIPKATAENETITIS